MKNLRQLKNGSMDLLLVSIHVQDINEPWHNVAILKDTRKNNFIVVCNLFIHVDNLCSWAFAYEYDISSLTEATQLFIKKIS